MKGLSMSIAGIMMQRMGMGMQYYGAGNAYQNMDNKLALANNVSFGSKEANYRDLANKDASYDVALQQNSLYYQVGQQMYDQGKRLQKDWAKSFSIFND